jgi:uncharacterized protein related to proFAR isomerase
MPFLIKHDLSILDRFVDNFLIEQVSKRFVASARGIGCFERLMPFSNVGISAELVRTIVFEW